MSYPFGYSGWAAWGSAYRKTICGSKGCDVIPFKIVNPRTNSLGMSIEISKAFVYDVFVQKHGERK
jgi:hypothetical protein